MPESRSLLITGGAGFIGGNFVHHRVRSAPADVIVVLDALTYAGNLRSLEPLVADQRVRFVHGDIGDAALVSSVLQDYAIDTIVHFAAESHVDRSILDPGAFVRTNVLGTQVLLDAARRAWYVDGAWKAGVRFHHVSTDEVYGTLSLDEPAFSETTPYAPNSPYAASKAGSDHLVRAYHHTYGLPTTISNCSNNYGAFHFPEKLIPLVIVNALQGKALPVYGDGRQIRDWLFVDDHCAAIDRILERGAPGSTYNVGGGAERTNIELITLLCRLLDARFAETASLRQRFPECPASSGIACSTLVTHVRDRPGHDRRYAINATKLATELGFTPRWSLDEGLQKTVDWYLTSESWWRAVLDGSYRDWIARHYGGDRPAVDQEV